MGAYVDPDKMIAARKGGAPPWELHERTFAGEFVPPKPYDPSVRQCHVWTAPAYQGLFCRIAFDRGCGHVFGLLMRVMMPVGPDVVR